MRENIDSCTSDFISNLIGINCSKKSSIHNILDSISFEGVTSDFFNLILSRLRISPTIKKESETSFGYIPYQMINKELISPSNKEMAYFKEYLLADLKMLLLKNATLNLSGSYSEKGSIKVGETDDLFFEYSEFKKKVCNLAEAIKFNGNKISALSRFYPFKGSKDLFSLGSVLFVQNIQGFT